MHNWSYIQLTDHSPHSSILKGGRPPPTQFFVDGCFARFLLLYTLGASPLQHKDKVPAEGAAH